MDRRSKERKSRLHLGGVAFPLEFWVALFLHWITILITECTTLIKTWWHRTRNSRLARGPVQVTVGKQTHCLPCYLIICGFLFCEDKAKWSSFSRMRRITVQLRSNVILLSSHTRVTRESHVNEVLFTRERSSRYIYM